MNREQEEIGDTIYNKLKADKVAKGMGNRAYITDILCEGLYQAGYRLTPECSCCEGTGLIGGSGINDMCPDCGGTGLRSTPKQTDKREAVAKKVYLMACGVPDEVDTEWGTCGLNMQQNCLQVADQILSLFLRSPDEEAIRNAERERIIKMLEFYLQVADQILSLFLRSPDEEAIRKAVAEEIKKDIETNHFKMHDYYYMNKFDWRTFWERYIRTI